jgi:hypothetical protein
MGEPFSSTTRPARDPPLTAPSHLNFWIAKARDSPLSVQPTKKEPLQLMRIDRRRSGKLVCSSSRSIQIDP